MSSGEQLRRRKSAFALVRELVSGGVGLVKLEVQRGRQEIGESLGSVKSGIILLAIAAAVALLVLIVLMSFIIFVIAALTGLALWVVAGIVLLLLILITGLLAWRGISKLTSAKLKPEETIESVKEDVAWAKRLLKRE